MDQKQFASRLQAWAPALGLIWGFAEGTVFFVVPDVLISLVAIYSFRRATTCVGMSLLGSLLAGVCIYYAALYLPDATRDVVRAVPFVSQKMLDTVQDEYRAQAIMALFNGPLSGKPYKIYALFAPSFVSLGSFVLFSIPVRLGRFAVVGGIAWLAGFLCRRFSPSLLSALPWVHAVLWGVFYAFYWSRIS